MPDLGEKKRIKVQPLCLVLLLFIAVGTCPVSMAQSFGQFKDAANECRNRKNFAEEEVYWKKALEKCSNNSTGTGSDPRYLECLLGLAQSYEAQNRADEAEALYKKIAMATAPGAILNESQAAAMHSYFDLLKKQNRSDEASELEKQYNLKAVVTRQDGENSDSSTKIVEWNREKFHKLINQGNQQFKQNQFPQAEASYKQALVLADTEAGPESSLSSEALNKLINICYKQKKYAQAEPYYARSLQIIRKHKGPVSAEYAEALGAHSQLLRMLNRKGEAIAEESRAEQIMVRYGLGSNMVGSGSPADARRNASSRSAREYGNFMLDLMNY